MFTNHTQRRNASIFVTFAAMLIAAVPFAVAQKGDVTLTGSKEAVALYWQGQLKAENQDDPGTFFDQAIQKDPNFAFGYLFAGQTNLDFQRNLQKAVSLADKASPGEREWIMAVDAANRGDQAAALTHWQNLAKLFPGDKRVQSQIGFWYRGSGDEATARKYFDAAAKIDSKWAPAYNNLGYSNVALGRWADAEKAFKTYISLIPNNPNPYDSYAEMLMNSGKFDESIKQYSMAISKDKTFYNSYRGIGDNYVYKGDFEKAHAQFKSMYDASAGNPAFHDLALVSMLDAFLSQGKFADALKVNDMRTAEFQKQNDPQSVFFSHMFAAFLATEGGDADAAARHLNDAADVMKDPSLPAALDANRKFNFTAGKVRLAIQKGDAAAAKGDLDWLATAAHNPNQQWTAYQLWGYSELKQGHYAKATEYLAKANQQDPLTWYYQAWALEAAGDKAAATKLYHKIADWDQLDTPNYAIARTRAIAKLGK
ncbi:MAG: tetratricopeptide repeat protein [Acidobacteria bacterium]|nr:tetratricopeptide repeat protein [Acidobacteriota bacterium]